ncbi:linear amide C-N hydrolase [Agromyces sp. NPDC058126]|uniref:linear amide C-N hydrolase n=1 Tax=Agromyces sp. NPDC058126 TaxID=3346350 RepID=UPI0036DD44D2
MDSLGLLSHDGIVCTRVMWEETGQPVIVGRNMDWSQPMGTNLWVMPRGAERVGMGVDDPNPLRWTARYGSVVATAYDAATSDGLNEAGLGAHLLWLAESDFGGRDPRLPALSVSLWTQYFLDRFATVAEAVAAIEAEPFQVRPQGDPNTGKTGTVHLALDDATGDSAIIEFLDGKPSVHHGHEYAVMTNSPPFDQQLTHLQRYAGFGGEEALPGTTEAADRFVRASYYLRRLPPASTPSIAYAALLSVMRNAAQPFGAPDPERPNISMTIWRTLSDLSNRIYAFESSFSPDIVWTHLDGIDFTRSARLDLSAGGLVGDVTDRFVPQEPFEFALP